MRVEIFVEFKIRASVNKHAAITSFLLILSLPQYVLQIHFISIHYINSYRLCIMFEVLFGVVGKFFFHFLKLKNFIISMSCLRFKLCFLMVYIKSISFS